MGYNKIITITIFIISLGLFSLVPDAFAASSASVSIPAGASVPGCEDENQCFIPSIVTIDVGGNVTWSNDDSAAHTIASGFPWVGPDGDFDSSLFTTGNTFSVKANFAGVYPYFCMVHPWMMGTVVVLDVSTPNTVQSNPSRPTTPSTPIDRSDKTYDVYIDKMPENWKQQFGHLYDEATAYWEKRIPGLQFLEQTQPEKADFIVQWGSQLIENRLGYWTDSDNAYGKPYMVVTLGYLDDESVPLDERKFNRVDSEYALEITKHEFGHAIGIAHSDDPTDIMYPTIYDYELWLFLRELGEQPNTKSETISFFTQALVMQEQTNFEIESLKYFIYSNEKKLSSLSYQNPMANEELQKARSSLEQAKEHLLNAEGTQKEGENLIANQKEGAFHKYDFSLEMSQKAWPELQQFDSQLSTAEELEKSYQESKSKEEPLEQTSEEKEKFCFLFWCW